MRIQKFTHILKYNPLSTNTSNDGDIRINLDDISCVYWSASGTVIVLTCGLEYTVKESLDDVLKVIQEVRDGTEEKECCEGSRGCGRVPKRRNKRAKGNK